MEPAAHEGRRLAANPKPRMNGLMVVKSSRVFAERIHEFSFTERSPVTPTIGPARSVVGQALR
jgi:hypothetical protein